MRRESGWAMPYSWTAFIQLGVGITHLREVSRPRPGTEMRKQRVVPGVAFELVYSRTILMQIPERDRTRRTGVLACGRDFIDTENAIFPLCGTSRPADALNAICAFLH